jgi:hypothetical protein
MNLLNESKLKFFISKEAKVPVKVTEKVTDKAVIGK